MFHERLRVGKFSFILFSKVFVLFCFTNKQRLDFVELLNLSIFINDYWFSLFIFSDFQSYFYYIFLPDCLRFGWLSFPIFFKVRAYASDIFLFF